jgi:hypothetical protein
LGGCDRRNTTLIPAWLYKKIVNKLQRVPIKSSFLELNFLGYEFCYFHLIKEKIKKKNQLIKDPK